VWDATREDSKCYNTDCKKSFKITDTVENITLKEINIKAIRNNNKDKKIEIFVKDLEGRSQYFIMQKYSRVDELMQLVEDKCGIQKKNQRLVFAGKQISPGYLLIDYNIPQHCTIHLTGNLRGD